MLRETPPQGRGHVVLAMTKQVEERLKRASVEQQIRHTATIARRKLDFSLAPSNSSSWPIASPMESATTSHRFRTGDELT